MAMPAFKATAAKRKLVELMKSDGWSDERIAAQLGCSRPTLLKHFASELEFGADRVRSEQLANLRRASRKGNVAASKALLARSDITAPPPDRKPDAPTVEPKLGKKAEREAEANAPPPDEWGNLVRH